MIHFDLPKEKSSIIKVIGVGGGGSNAVNHMHAQTIEGVNFIICNTDAQALAISEIPNKIQLGPHLTQGLGAGANPEIGRQATEESLEEIKGILEVNTKMAFITAGMGGGTGTGGAPIIAKICKDLGILTVGIVSTPFAYEGKKRQLQAEEGINTLKSYVDTLLVISNDKLRHQFGNLRMSEAFAKADNVLSTAAKCITDVINSTGQINVDFADVCTVMKNGGVAILGSAAESGDDRAGKAIEEALNSPLLNDNDIAGAKWILLNINSSKGEYEHTMDEVEIIQNYLLSKAGEDTDVILGLGYDEALQDKIGITIIATGFQHNNSFTIPKPVKEEPKEEKIIMVLEQNVGDIKPLQQNTEKPLVQADKLAPVLVEDFVANAIPMPVTDEWKEQEMPASQNGESIVLQLEFENSFIKKEEPKIKKEEDEFLKENHLLIPEPEIVTPVSVIQPSENITQHMVEKAQSNSLTRPANIYAENSNNSKPIAQPTAIEEIKMQLIEKEEPKPTSKDVEISEIQTAQADAEDLPIDEEEAHRKKAGERLRKLRNLTFDINAADPNNEYETVPAYIRKNMDLYNSSKQVEDYYSKYQVKADENNKGSISTINVFLDGNKPD